MAEFNIPNKDAEKFCIGESLKNIVKHRRALYEIPEVGLELPKERIRFGKFARLRNLTRLVRDLSLTCENHLT